MKTVIHWFRRDLRITDNTALSEAGRRAAAVIPVFILEDALRTGPDVGAARLAFLLQSLEALRGNLASLGYPLIVRQGRSEEEIPRLCQELTAEAVFCNRRYEPYAEARDGHVATALSAIGVGMEVFKDAVVWEERDILTQAGHPFTVFTPYARAWRTRKVPPPRPKPGPAPAVLASAKGELDSTDPARFGHPLTHSLPPAGERAALEQLKRFLAGPVLAYGAQRNFPAIPGTSQLSAHLRAGTLGVRTVLARLAAVRAAAGVEGQRNCDVFLNELIWREFYLQILVNFPHVMKGSFRQEYDDLAWSEDESHFQAWCAGQTGYPIVDAAMRCLKATGWMHNRLRMVTAMFLTKDLLLPWQRGERHFMRLLVDGDLAANNGGWQWAAGTGTDAAPYFRIFNPVLQGEKFDPEGKFVREWVPELTALPNAVLHQPWKAAGTAATRGYPDRIVVHEVQRPKCLAMYQAVARLPRPAG